MTWWSVDTAEVGAADPGNEPYVVVSAAVPLTVTVAVTVSTDELELVLEELVSDVELDEVELPVAVATKAGNLEPGLMANTMPC